jgi:peptide/nickel transport system permease protein
MIQQLLKRLRDFPIPLPRKQPRRLLKFLRRFGRRFNIAGLIFLSVVVAAALGADLLASDTPLAYHLNGETHILPGVFNEKQIGNLDNETVLASIYKPGEWVVLPPVPYGPNRTKIAGRVNWLSPPGKNHLLGTDDKGRDVLARLIHGARSSLLVGLGSVSLYLLVAILLGATAGYFGGLADRVALRVIETLSSFPAFFLILALQGLLGATSLTQLILIIGLTRWTDVARLTRAEVLRVANEDYVLAARALGLRQWRILLRHVLPGAMEPALVAATFGVGSAILVEATLSFLGYGVPETTASWGQLIGDAFNNDGAYWLSLFPGMLLFLTILSINLVGEGLRDALDLSN